MKEKNKNCFESKKKMDRMRNRAHLYGYGRNVEISVFAWISDRIQ
jgi:hypothetical protein